MTGAGFPHSDIHGSNACKAANRGFSQPTTSFIGSRRQGIHRWLFVAWNYLLRCSCSLCNSQEARLTSRQQNPHVEPNCAVRSRCSRRLGLGKVRKTRSLKTEQRTEGRYSLRDTGDATPRSVVYIRSMHEDRRASKCANWESPSRHDANDHDPTGTVTP